MEIVFQIIFGIICGVLLGGLACGLAPITNIIIVKYGLDFIQESHTLGEFTYWGIAIITWVILTVIVAPMFVTLHE